MTTQEREELIKDINDLAESLEDQGVLYKGAFLRQAADLLAEDKWEAVGEVTEAVDGAFKCEFNRVLSVGTKLFTRPQQAERAPQGWKLVPVEPTPEMLAALWAYKSNTLQEMHRALLDAAPSAPKEPT